VVNKTAQEGDKLALAHFSHPVNSQSQDSLAFFPSLPHLLAILEYVLQFLTYENQIAKKIDRRSFKEQGNL
jgi:hypothetical protein